jgi:hypothetical protein
MNFDATRLRRSDQIIGAGAVLFFIFLFFFDWYGISSNVASVDGVNVGGSFSYNGWHTFTNSRWIWLLTIIVALVAVALRAGLFDFESPVQPAVVVLVLGALSCVLIIYRIVHHPTFNASFGGVHTSVGIKIGIWLGLIAAAAITYGGYLAMQDEGASLADVRAQAGGGVSGLAGSGGGDAGGAGGASASGQAGAPSAPSSPAPAPPPVPPPGSPEPPGAATA